MSDKRYIKAPEYTAEIALLPKRDNLFLAGSITGARDWQSEIIDIDCHWCPQAGGNIRTTLREKFNIFNPRRDNFDASDAGVEKEQIAWEFQCIHSCKYLLFWFDKATLAPITLFEYGNALNTHYHDDIFVGVDPEYARRNDVYIQTKLRDSPISKRISTSIKELAQQVIEFSE